MGYFGHTFFLRRTAGRGNLVVLGAFGPSDCGAGQQAEGHCDRSCGESNALPGESEKSARSVCIGLRHWRLSVLLGDCGVGCELGASVLDRVLLGKVQLLPGL